MASPKVSLPPPVPDPPDPDSSVLVVSLESTQIKLLLVSSSVGIVSGIVSPGSSDEITVDSTPIPSVSSVGLSFRPGGGAPITHSSYLNPRLQQNVSLAQSGEKKSDGVEQVMEILGRAKKKNLILVGDSEPGWVIHEIFKKIEVGEVLNLAVKKSKVIHLDEINSDKAIRIKELDGLLETRINNLDPDGGGGGGVILDLGDLKWLGEQPSSTQPPPTVAVEVGRTAVAELRRLLEKFEGRLWLIGTATCETYLRCQVYHSSMETDWDLQAMSVAAKAPASCIFPRSEAFVFVVSIEAIFI